MIPSFSISRGTNLSSKEPVKAIIPTESDTAKMSKISGVVTFLSRFEFKSDVGSVVYFADSANLKDFNYATLDTFYNYIVYKNYIRTWTARPSNKLIANIYDEGEKYNFDKASFKLLDKRATVNIAKLVDAENSSKANVDGSGNYSVTLRPGIYYVLFKSRNSTRLDKFETSEQFKCNKLNISEGENVKMSYAFGFEYK